MNKAKRIRVCDSSIRVRYLILSQRPAGTDGPGENDLAQLAMRDSMLGTGDCFGSLPNDPNTRHEGRFGGPEIVRESIFRQYSIIRCAMHRNIWYPGIMPDSNIT